MAGKNDIAVDVLLYCKRTFPGHRLVCITNRNESGINTWQKSLKWFAEKNDVEIIELKDVYDIDDLLFLSTEFDRIIRPAKFKTTELYNIHFSLLPKYKGCFTAIMPLLNGEDFTGVTLHRIRDGIDTGEIIDQKRIDISDDDTSLDVYKKCLHYGTELVIKNLNNLLSGNIKTSCQNSKHSTYYSNSTIDYSNLRLNVNSTAYQIQNQVRAFCFRPYQLLKWNGVSYVECVITENVSSEKPGTILEDTDIYSKISTIDYDVIMYKDTFDELLKCISEYSNERAKYLCTSRKLITEQDKHGWSPLTVAVYNNNFEMVQWLVDNGADINVVNNNGTNLLMYAKNCFVNTGNPAIFEYLVNKGLPFDQKDYYGKDLYDYCKMEEIKMIGKYDLTKELSGGGYNELIHLSATEIINCRSQFLLENNMLYAA